MTRALVVIDIQNDYFPGGRWELDGMDAAAANAARVLAAARTAGDTVVHVRHEFPTADAPFFAPGTEGAAIHASVAPTGDEAVVTKSEINAFLGTDLKARLDDAGVTDIVFVGAMSHMCVDAAVRAASDHGYACTLVHDACATRGAEFDGALVPAADVHASFRSALGFAYAKTVPTDTHVRS